MNTKHLKAKILNLAIRGKLVPQDSSEGNAADLLKKIRDEKTELIKQKKIKEDKNASFIIKIDDGRHYEQFADGTLKDIEDEIPFEIPESWCWCKINEIANKITDGEHNTPKRVNSFKGFYLLSARNIQDGHIALNDVDYVDEQEFNRIFSRCNPQRNDVLISCSGSVGRCTRIEDDNKYVMVRSAAMISAPGINTKYLMYTIQSPELQNQIQYASKQTAQANLFQGAISNLIIPLPPLSEQQRIVSAIEKAFEQIDIVEKNKINLKTYIKQTKSKVLDLAIHGKLVEQNPQEGNAFELLEKIRNEKAELIKQKKLKEDKSASFIIKTDDGKHYEQFADGILKDIEEEKPFEIPENWCWTCINSINTFDSVSVNPMLAVNKSKLYELYSVPSFEKRYPEIINGEKIGSTKLTVKKGDVLLSKINPRINRVWFVEQFTSNELIASGEWIVVRNQKIDSKFLMNIFQTPYFRSQMLTEVSGVGGSLMRARPEAVKKYLFPLPPLSEQQRIVAKIEQIFAQLDALEKSLGE